MLDLDLGITYSTVCLAAATPFPSPFQQGGGPLANIMGFGNPATGGILRIFNSGNLEALLGGGLDGKTSGEAIFQANQGAFDYFAQQTFTQDPIQMSLQIMNEVYTSKEFLDFKAQSGEGIDNIMNMTNSSMQQAHDLMKDLKKD